MANLEQMLAHIGEPGIIIAAYVVAAVLFILCLGGLSGQESAKRAVWYGIAGMALAVGAAVFTPGVGNHWLIALMLLVGAVLGYFVAIRVQMTEMPQLVAALHSFVGLAAVFIGFNTHIELAGLYDVFAVMRDPAGAAFGNIEGLVQLRQQTEEMTGFAVKLLAKTPAEISILMVETYLGVFIGAVTFTGSVIAFGKLAGKVDGKAKKLPGGHMLNAAAAILSLILLVVYLQTGAFWALAVMTLLAFFIGYHLIM